MSDLKNRLEQDLKQCMRDKNKTRISTMRLIMAAIKQIEVDKRIEMKDSDIIEVLDKMTKQRRDSIEQFTKANRNDLVDIEVAELDLIQSYLPTPLSSDEIKSMIDAAIKENNANSVQDMGKVMGTLKPQVQGRADMKQVSLVVRELLT